MNVFLVPEMHKNVSNRKGLKFASLKTLSFILTNHIFEKTN